MNRQRLFIRSLAAGLFFALAVSANGDDGGGFRPFARGEYGAGEFGVTARTYPHGRLNIKVTQAKRLEPRPQEAPYACRAWLEVADGGRDTWQRSFDDISPAGFSYGLFVPRKPPSTRYFAVVKTGDNDGRLFLIDRETGAVTDLPGGFYFVTADGRHLFSEYAGETQDVVVFDLVAGKVVLDTRASGTSLLPGGIYDWYYDGKRYFFTITRDEAGGVVAEDRRALYEVNLKHPGIDKVPPDFSKLHHKRWDFDPRRFRDCVSDVK